MIKVYIGTILNFSYLPLLYPNLGFQEKKTLPFLSKAFKYLRGPYVEITDNPRDADFLLIPHNYFLIKDKKDYIGHFISLSESTKKKIIIFAYGDSDKDIPIPNSIIFRTSQYRHKKQANEIMMPAYTEDLASDTEIILRNKKDKPTVGFCGWADLPNFKAKIKFYAKIFMVSFKKYLTLNISEEARKQGLYFRRKAIKALEKSGLVKTDFIIRKSYSGHINTIESDPLKMRQEFIENLKNSDFILVSKGDGNFSYRFYEALSLGRVPVLIDTETVLPLENIIDYDSFILRVNYKDITKLDKIIADFYKKITNEKFIEMQKKAREAFEEYLRIDSFFNYVFSNGLLHNI